jgi:hypothetical protein
MAKMLCPEAVFIRGDMELYTRLSRIVTQIIAEKAPLFEKALLMSIISILQEWNVTLDATNGRMSFADHHSSYGLTYLTGTLGE